MATDSVNGFYAGKNLFITGGTGFVGICLLEKILRCIPEHGEIYLLMRAKKGKSMSERLEEVKKNSVFTKLLEEKKAEEVFNKVFPIAGDVGEESLGMQLKDRQQLAEKIDVIIHSAATLDFGESLKTTVNINLLGTRRITEFAKECRQLKALVHVSSAYVNSYLLETKEIIYPLPMKSEALIETVNTLSPEKLEEKTPEILGDHPNSYTITKHMAEHEIANVQELFPCTIVRPSMITSSLKEPIPGWTISKNGPSGFFMGAQKGVVRRLPVAKNLIYDYIPVDIVVNQILVAGFHAAVTKPKQVEIYHCTTSTRNPFRWVTVEDGISENMRSYPLKSAVWFAYLRLLPNITWFKISAIFVHWMPAFILDMVLRVTGGRPMLVKLHTNINVSLNRLSKFIFTEWKFSAEKSNQLMHWMLEKDRKVFFIDVNEIKWVDYFVSMYIGVRTYLNKEPLSNLPAAKKKNEIFYYANLVVQALFLTVFWFLIACLTGTTMSGSVFVLPILYILFTFI